MELGVRNAFEIPNLRSKRMFKIINPIDMEKRNNTILAFPFSIFICIENESKENEVFPHNSMPNKL